MWEEEFFFPRGFFFSRESVSFCFSFQQHCPPPLHLTTSNERTKGFLP
jgi:hypothetical protein